MEDKIYNIAVVDDTVEILDTIAKSLSRNKHYRVTTYANPLTALSSIDDKTDLVLLDIVMPQMNGIDVLQKLMEQYPEIKIIMMTANSTLDRVLKAHKYGARHYLMKPFDSIASIENKIEQVLNS